MKLFKRRSKKQASAAKAPFIYPAKDAPCPVSDDWPGFDYCFRYDETKGSPGEAKAYINPNGQSFLDYANECFPDEAAKLEQVYATPGHLMLDLINLDYVKKNRLYYPQSIDGGFIFNHDRGEYDNFRKYNFWLNGHVNQCVILDNPDSDKIARTCFLKDRSQLPDWPILSEEQFYEDRQLYARDLDKKMHDEIPFRKRTFDIHDITGEQLEKLLAPEGLKEVKQSTSDYTHPKTKDGQTHYCVRTYAKKKSPSVPKKKMSDEKASRKLTGLKSQISAETEAIMYLEKAIRTGRISPAIMSAIYSDGYTSVADALNGHIDYRKKLIKRFDTLREQYPNVKLGILTAF